MRKVWVFDHHDMPFYFGLAYVNEFNNDSVYRFREYFLVDDDGTEKFYGAQESLNWVRSQAEMNGFEIEKDEIFINVSW